jgi:hypothetical protein
MLTIIGPMLTIIMTSEHIGRWVRMRRLFVRFSGQGVSSHTRSLADFITTTSVSRVFGTHRMPPRAHSKQRAKLSKEPSPF